ncbi:hypothetical protein, partial [Streptomyces sp. sk226]|uniref:hypothetical protein n=1 Tax=Streptomyces sp. sk226 TaxID=2034268 RepID=UPI0027BA9B59
MDEPAAEHAHRADRDLVLVGPTGQDTADPGRGAAVDHLGQVQQTAPAPGLFQADDLAEAPQGCLGRVDSVAGAPRVGAVDGDGAAGGDPQRGVGGRRGPRPEGGGGCLLYTFSDGAR